MRQLNELIEHDKMLETPLSQGRESKGNKEEDEEREKQARNRRLLLYFQKHKTKPAGDIRILNNLKSQMPEFFVPKTLNPTINFLEQVMFEQE